MFDMESGGANGLPGKVCGKKKDLENEAFSRHKRGECIPDRDIRGDTKTGWNECGPHSTLVWLKHEVYFVTGGNRGRVMEQLC